MISNSSTVSRSAAVTVIVKVFSPARRSLSPVISKKASGSVVSTTTSTSVVSGAISTTAFGSASSPLICNTAIEVSSLYKTFRVTT